MGEYPLLPQTFYCNFRKGDKESQRILNAIPSITVRNLNPHTYILGRSIQQPPHYWDVKLALLNQKLLLGIRFLKLWEMHWHLSAEHNFLRPSYFPSPNIGPHLARSSPSLEVWPKTERNVNENEIHFSLIMES